MSELYLKLIWVNWGYSTLLRNHSRYFQTHFSTTFLKFLNELLMFSSIWNKILMLQSMLKFISFDNCLKSTQCWLWKRKRFFQHTRLRILVERFLNKEMHFEWFFVNSSTQKCYPAIPWNIVLAEIRYNYEKACFL